jgi:hypothetical protein
MSKTFKVIDEGLPLHQDAFRLFEENLLTDLRYRCGNRFSLEFDRLFKEVVSVHLGTIYFGMTLLKMMDSTEESELAKGCAMEIAMDLACCIISARKGDNDLPPIDDVCERRQFILTS